MPSLWEVLKASKGLPAPDGFTALFARSLSDTYTLAEISGIPPLNLGEIVEIVDYTIYGNTYQAEGVSPDNPQEVVGVGERTANLFNGTIEQGSLADANGAENASTVRVRISPISVKPNETYTISANLQLRNIIVLKDGVFVESLQMATKTHTFTVPENANQIRASFCGNPAGTVEVTPNDLEWLMLNTGETALPYEPYGYKIPVGTRGKNFFDISTAVLGKYINSNGEEVVSNGISNHSDFIPVVGDKEFTLSSYKPSYNAITYAIAWYTSDKEFIYRDSEVALSNEGRFLMTRVSPTNARYAIINFSDYINFQKENIQFELGSTATEYSPYVEPITTTVYLDTPLHKIGNYTDVLSYSGKSVERVLKELILTGDEDWFEYSLADTYRLSLSGNTGITGYGLSTHFKCVATTSELVHGSFVSGTNSSYFKYENSSLSDFKAYLAEQYAAGTPVKVYYVLAAPVTETVELPEIPALDGTTVIDVDTEVKPSNLKITYKSKM